MSSGGGEVERSPRMVVMDDYGSKPSFRQRFWQFMVGEPLMTRRQAQTFAENAIKMHMTTEADNPLTGARKFQIIDAVNGKIIRYTSVSYAAPKQIGVPGEQYYIVKESDDLLGAIASILVLDRVK